MAERFATCLALVLKLEGGYVDNPNDPGGATNRGITRRTLAAWRQIRPWADLAKTEVKSLSRAEAAQIYRANYWDVIRGDALVPGLDLALFDFAINSGPGRAVKTLQRLLGVVADGVIGVRTLAAIDDKIAAAGASNLVRQLCADRLVFLQTLSTFAHFGVGWTRRVKTVQAAALAAAAKSRPKIPSTTIWSSIMALLSGYKTYIVAAIMVLAGIAQILGIDLPAMDGSSAGQLIMQALAMIFLRHGIKNTAGSA
ncbi:glycosyl hydrolase 108 family protein [Devosia algicola]|uniref:Glycosyl hydrolase 108 family protein n=1 Tax=Devosia algicola TaxID=3026418 RepID=A0ABY7YNJ0_9HYPH|nr:glycosyl hydrolase 108 family protein [Devosia algicola]WDR02762.1 glycosyl hydrolase 108 family protein [Devosia algicola]